MEQSILNIHDDRGGGIHAGQLFDRQNGLEECSAWPPNSSGISMAMRPSSNSLLQQVPAKNALFVHGADVRSEAFPSKSPHGRLEQSLLFGEQGQRRRVHSVHATSLQSRFFFSFWPSNRASSTGSAWVPDFHYQNPSTDQDSHYETRFGISRKRFYARFEELNNVRNSAYQKLRELLVDARKKAELTQSDLSSRLESTSVIRLQVRARGAPSRRC